MLVLYLYLMSIQNEKQGDEWDENVSISSQGGLPPPAKQGSSKGRIGQLIKKLSGGGQQKPISATSMFSLNHVFFENKTIDNMY